MPYVKNKIRVQVPHRSGFDKSHRHSGSLLCGQITPILCDELIPNSRVSLRIPISVQLPPLVSDTYMNVKAKVEAFFVPSRLLCASFEDFFCDFPRRVFTTDSSTSDQSSGSFQDVIAAIPVLNISPSGGAQSGILAPGSLMDRLGVRAPVSASAFSYYNPLPLIAYHLVWQEWYRNPRVQNPAFAHRLGDSDFAVLNNFVGAAYLPYSYFHRSFVADGGYSAPDNSILPVNSSNLNSYNLADGVSLFALRQRNFGLDYFTGSRVSAQQGQPSAVDIAIPAGTDSAGGTASFSIAQLRAMNSIQQFRERNNIPSPRLVDQVRARYNANLSDGVAQRPICIGSASYDVYSRGVDQTSDSNDAVATPENLFSGVGAQYGRAGASGNDFLIQDFVANEPGYLLVNLTLVPEVTYSTGIPSMFTRYQSVGSITDMACCLLQNVGDQPIYQREITGFDVNTVFGYQDRYADWMYLPNRTSGLLRDGQSLSQFVLQRSLVGSPTINSSFLQIPTTYLDGVMTVSSLTSGVSAWFDCMLNYKVSMPLAEFSIPSLQDPAYEHGESVVLRRNGQIF